MAGYKRCSEGALKAQSDGWILVHDHLPPAGEEVEILGRNYIQKDIFLGTARFDPTTGWEGVAKVYAWKSPSSTLRMLRENYPRKLI